MIWYYRCLVLIGKLLCYLGTEEHCHYHSIYNSVLQSEQTNFLKANKTKNDHQIIVFPINLVLIYDKKTTEAHREVKAREK